MRGTDIHSLKKLYVKIRLRLPDVQHYAQRLSSFQPFQQRSVIYHRSAAGVDQNRSWLQTANQRLIRQMQGFIWPFFIQWGMEGEDISFLNQRIEGAEIAFVSAIGARRIAEQRFDPQRFQPFLQSSTDVADANDPDGTIAQRETVAFGQHQ